MTNEEKKRQRYIAAVERRLNLPREIKARVMSDFVSGIQARRDSGMSDEQICAELGSAQKAAADLNEQMKEYACRKSPWRFAFLACAVYGLVELLGSLLAWVVFPAAGDPVLHIREAATIGIIGGADGPTAIFVTTPEWTGCVVPVLALIIGIWGYLRLRKCRQKE